MYYPVTAKSIRQQHKYTSILAPPRHPISRFYSRSKRDSRSTFERVLNNHQARPSVGCVISWFSPSTSICQYLLSSPSLSPDSTFPNWTLGLRGRCIRQTAMGRARKAMLKECFKEAVVGNHRRASYQSGGSQANTCKFLPWTNGYETKSFITNISTLCNIWWSIHDA